MNLLVVQPLPGIGDMVWHLPHIRALARAAGEPVTLLAKPRSLADELFAAEDTVRDVIWLDRNPRGRVGRNDGPAGLLRLISTLRTRRFDEAVLLHHSLTLAIAVWAAGIPVRRGYGAGVQRWFLNGAPFLSAAELRQHQIARATAFLRAAGIAMPESEPHVSILESARAIVRGRLGDESPYVVLGIGSSEPHRQWGAARFAELARELIAAGLRKLVLLAGPEEAPLAQEIARAVPGECVCSALGWHLTETVALLAGAVFYVGNDTGMMNLAAATGTRSYALFGASPVLRHSTNIVPITPVGEGGMAGISVAAVLAAIGKDVMARMSPA